MARAFAFHADVTGDPDFLSDKAWPVLRAVGEWITTRVKPVRGGYAIDHSMGIAERKISVRNAAFTNMAASVVLGEVIGAAERLGRAVDPAWPRIASRLELPRRDGAVVSHEAFRIDEEKGATPDPLMRIWPLGYRLSSKDEQATLALYLGQAEAYIGSPMLSALYGVWAARVGDRRLSLKLLDEGYAQFAHGRFDQILEYRPDRFPEQPMAGPFFANMGGFLAGLLLGFPRLRPGPGEPDTWAEAEVVLPEGWRAIEVDRLWIRGKPMRLIAPHGETARLEPL